MFNKQLLRFKSLQKSLFRNYLNKGPSQVRIGAVEVTTKEINTLELKHKNNVGSTQEIQDKLFTNKPFFIRQKRDNYYDSIFPMKFIDSNNFRKCGVRLYSLSLRPFSIKEEKIDVLKPEICHGGDFMDLVTRSSIFVDKTMFIKEIIEDSSRGLLITMPRRWGKSLNLDMLRRFLSIQIKNGQPITNVTTDNYKLFAGGEIEFEDVSSKNKRQKRKIISPCKLVRDYPEILDDQGQYPVIFFDFQNCKAGKLDEVKSELKKNFIKTINQFDYLKNSVQKIRDTITIGKEYNELLESAKSGDIRNAILELSSLLYHHHNKKVWILIDEYDAAANKAYLEFTEGEAKEVADLFRGVLESALKGNPFLEKGVMTGVLPVLLDDMSSGLNNLNLVNVTNKKYSKYYGVDQEEMKLLLEHFKIDNQTASQIKYWYNGYKSKYGTEKEPVFVDKYNIWSVVSYLNEQDSFQSYWGNSSLWNIVDGKIFNNTIIKKRIERLIMDEPLFLGDMIKDFGIYHFKVLKEIIKNHDKVEIYESGVNVLFYYLFFNGYLTITSNKNYYAIPNNEIRLEIAKKLTSYYKDILRISNAQMNELTKDLDSIFSNDDGDQISNILTKEFGPRLQALVQTLEICNEDKKPEVIKGVLGNEDFFHSLLNLIALQIKDAFFGTEVYTIKPNESKGRIDLTLTKNNISVIFEIKYTKVKKKNDQAIKRINEAAFRQAKKYENEIRNSNIKVFVVCNFTDKKEVFLFGEIIKGKKHEKFEYPTIKKR